MTENRSRATFWRWYGPREWFFRIHGWGVGFRDHRDLRPLVSERYRLNKNRYLHVGPFCIAFFHKETVGG